ncbi:MAG: molybdopterin dehydrogenase [Proteobacteria bacterium]|nr:MAG: molybdopterin dehydrogenase [Pseudomonadota bacterium]
MRPFEYAAPKTTQQAVGLLGANAQILAGGTDLLALMKDDIVQPKRVVNVKDITNLGHMGAMGPDTYVIGALAKLSDIADNVEVRKRFPMFANAVDEAASPQIRNMATIGGNLCQRPRCWYFRNGFGLLAMKDGKSMMADGDNRNHAIIGNDGPAKFVSPSTIAPALIAYGAGVTMASPKGSRAVPLAKFYRTPKTETEREHDLQPEEMLVEIVFSARTPLPKYAAQYEVRQKAAFDWPLALASVALWMDGDKVKKANIVLGAVAPVPWLSEEAAQALVGKELNQQTIEAAAQAAVSIAKPLSMNAYKVQLTRVAVKRALMQAVEGGRG